MAKFEIENKAADLIHHTITITSNRKRYPNKYITLIKRIQNTSMDIYEAILNANELDLRTQKQLRLETQTRAIRLCDRLSCLVEMSMGLKLIGSDVVNIWQKHIGEVKRMTKAWRKKDSAR